MLKTFSYHLLFVASLFLLPTSTQVLAVDNNDDLLSTMEMADKVNINKASDNELASIKGIGAKKAQAIISYRDENGDFANIEDLMKVKGIGKGTLQKIIPFVSI